MDNLQRLIQLAKADGGKFFILDEQANPVLVIMGIDDYERVLINKIKQGVDEIEEVNKTIAEVQSKEQQYQEDLRSEVIDSTFEFESSGQNQTLDEI